MWYDSRLQALTLCCSGWLHLCRFEFQVKRTLTHKQMSIPNDQSRSSSKCDIMYKDLQATLLGAYITTDTLGSP